MENYKIWRNKIWICGVVIVTFNRLEKLKIALEKYENQTYKPKYVLIINNCSTDGTEIFLTKWQAVTSSYKKYVLNLEQNLGGAGGFNAGLEKAKELEADWIWVSDDDAYPKENAFEEANNFIQKTDSKEISAICGKIINNGKIDLIHRRRIKKRLFSIREVNVKIDEYNKEYFYIDTFSYVGTIIKKEVLNKVGTTKKDFFIYYDDVEHSYRISKSGLIVCVPKIEVEHNVEGGKKVTWKAYYGSRNKMIFYKLHFKKRYFEFEYIKQNILQRLKIIIKKILRRDYTVNIMILEGVKDSKNSDNLKLHDVYRPR